MRFKKTTIKKIKKATDGVISIILIIAILPFFSLAAAFVEAERYQNAVKALDEALGSSALSVLSQYDSYLLNRFGLLAVKQSDDENFMQTQLNKYLHLQNTTDMKGAGVNTLEAEVEGAFPLADISVLKQQILSYSYGLVPAKVTAEALQLDSLVGELEKSFCGAGLTAIFGQVKDGAKLLNSEADMIDAINDAKKEMEKTSTAISDYDSKFQAFEAAMNELYNHSSSTIPEDEDGAKAWQNTLKDLQDKAKRAKEDYVAAIDSTTRALDNLYSCLEDVIEGKNGMVSSAASFATSSGNALLTVESDSTKDEAEKTKIKNVIKTSSATSGTVSSMMDKVDQAIDDLNEESFEAAAQALDNEKQSVNSADTNAGYTGSRASQYHYANLEKFRDVNQLKGLVEDMEQEAKSGGWLDTILAAFDIIDELFAVNLFFDPELSATLDVDYYEDNYGGLPSGKNRNLSQYSLDPAHSAEDETRSKEYLAAIDPDYDPDDPYGFYANSTASKLDALIQSVNQLKNKRDELEDADWVSDKIRAFANCADQVWDVIEKFDALQKDIAKNIVQKLYERMLVMGYLAYNLPNRTNYGSGRTLSGYSFSNAALAPSVTGSNIPIFNIGMFAALVTPNQNYSFSGAELEYIMTGFQSEISNQAMVFLEMWCMRALLDVVPIITNSEVNAIVEGLCATIIGSIAAAIYLILLIIAEPLLDVFILANGGKIRIYKMSDEIFFTVAGLDDLAGAVSQLTFSDSKKASVESAAEKATKGKIGTATDKWMNDLGKLDYTQHALLLMMLTGSETTYLNRLTDIIQAEGTYRSHNEGATMSQTALGRYTNFDVEKAYTTMRIEAKGALEQFLPVPSVFSPSGTNAFDTPFRYDRVLYRGY